MKTRLPGIIARRLSRPKRSRQQGAAIVTALVVVTLAAVVVSGLFYRESVAVRSIENRLAISQTRWVERAALDWARVILRVDSNPYDHPSDVWGTPVAETQLDETVTGGANIGDRARNAFLAGAITDAQAKFNVLTLVEDSGVPSVPHMQAMQRLMSLLGLPESLVPQLIARILRSRPQTLDGRVVPPLEIPLVRFGDLRDIQGFTEPVMQALQPHVTVLPVPPGGNRTTINVNTASAEVIAAATGADLSAARSLVAQREHLPFRTMSDVWTRLGQGSSETGQLLLSVNTSFFLVNGLIRYDRVESHTETLIRRDSVGSRGAIQVVWQHRN
jgi:general secretion pathway protein K